MLDEKTKSAAMAAIQQLLEIVDQADAGKLPSPVSHGAPPDHVSPPADMGAAAHDEADEDPKEEATETPEEEKAEDQGPSEDDQLDEMTQPENGHGPEIARTVALLRLKKQGR